MRYNKGVMREEKRPDPDELLARIKEEEERSKRGKLKIFLGYVAGVGKTYAMLEAAHQRKAEGIDVVVGYAETHGRKETEALLSGLELIPRKKIEYRGTSLTEMDLDAVITRHPRLVLVDELAHTNSPGTRHPKRYQDVDEILAAGIDVYSTVNIQHLESLSDIVLQITGISVREKIPDRLVDEADEIELIDLPTDELLQRLKDGKVYISDQALRALEKFFRKGNLTALRELAMRRAADRVDNQMLSYMHKKAIPGPWPAADRILVCISSHPMGERLIRSGRRLAEDLNAEWYVLFVETAQHLHMPLENRLRVQRFMRLAEELGAKIATTSGESVADTVLDFAHEHNITKIIAGKPFRPRWSEILRGSVIDQIIRESGSIDVFVISGESTMTKQTFPRGLRLHKPLWRYAVSLILIFLVTLAGIPLKGFLDPTNLVMIYLLGVVLAAVFLGRGPSILASVTSVLAFDFFFIKPVYKFTVDDTQYLLTFAGLFTVSLIISSSAALLRDQVDSMRRKEHQSQSMLNLSRELTGAVSLDEVLTISQNACVSAMSRECAILLPQNGKLAVKSSSPDVLLDENELAVADWSFKHAHPTGRGTDTLPASTYHFLPLITANGTVGVIGLHQLDNEPALSIDQRLQLEGLANLTALSIERAQLVESAAQSEMLQKTEKLQTALLNSISHELRTPLASITGVLTTLAEVEKSPAKLRKMDASTRVELLNSATDQAGQLNRLVENLLNMTRLESGNVRLNLGVCDLQDLIGSILQQFSSRLTARHVELRIPDNLFTVKCDANLIAVVLTNLLDNACKYTPDDSPITILAENCEKSVEITISDAGMGLADNELEKVFDKFYRSPNQSKLSGTGLGLSICRGIIEAHGGWIRAETNPGKGLKVRFSLPFLETSVG
jgi:two-component system, OmpR family, sensor histidine kinase KdpD